MMRDEDASVWLIGFMIAAAAGSLVGFLIGRLTA